jgi:hypothetical protein
LRVSFYRATTAALEPAKRVREPLLQRFRHPGVVGHCDEHVVESKLPAPLPPRVGDPPTAAAELVCGGRLRRAQPAAVRPPNAPRRVVERNCQRLRFQRLAAHTKKSKTATMK